jgi:Protein of unknown function (DUF2934)
MELSLHHRIRQRAYEIWDAGGRLDGQAEQHWLAAEREALEQMNAHVAGSTLGSRPRQKRSGVKNGFRHRNSSTVPPIGSPRHEHRRVRH